jgi:thymidylate kinase
VNIDSLVAGSADEHRERNGVPTAAQAEQRERAARLIRSVLGDVLAPDGLAVSPLGIAWTDVFDAVVTTQPGAAQLEAHGWVRLDALLRRLDPGAEPSWAVVDGGELLAAVRLLDAATDPVGEILRRAHLRGEVRLREVLELQVLRAKGLPFPEASAVLTAAADIEANLGRRELVHWASGRRTSDPAQLGGSRRRVLVACTGVDGAGKSTLLAGLRRDLAALGIPVSRVWLRPGMGLGPLASVAAEVKRRLRIEARPGIAAVSEDPDVRLRSRRGVVGWVWSLLVTLSFLLGVRRQHAASHGVVLYDRHLADALATLDFAYGGAGLGVQRWLMRRLMPAADVTFHLDVTVEEAVRRKPGDAIGERAVRRQLSGYERELRKVAGVQRLDATQPADELVRAALVMLLRHGSAHRGRGWAPDRAGLDA